MKEGTWTISAPCQNGFSLQQASHGKSQLYEIRIGQFSSYHDEFINEQVREDCNYDQSTHAIVRDLKDRITYLGFSVIKSL